MRFVVSEEEAGRRIDALVSERLELPRTSVQAAVAAGSITVAGAPVKQSYRVVAGEEVVAEVDASETGLPEGEQIPLDIRYSDARLLVVSKPAGLVVHPGGGHAKGTLVNALIGEGGPLSAVDPSRPGVVHRLDRDTSGLLLVAKDDDAHEHLAGALKAREVRREYLALVRGRTGTRSGSIEAPIGRHPSKRSLMAVVSGGRDAVTHYSTLAEGAGATLLRVRLETGRTHQIRVHLAHLGHPVLGDRVYGGVSEVSRALGLTRPFLHAVRLVFPHPDDGRLVTVEDDLPPELGAVLERAGISFP